MESIRFSPGNIVKNIILFCVILKQRKHWENGEKSCEGERNKGSQAVIKIGIYGIMASSDGL